MNWAWASSLDHIWRSPSFPMWLTLAAAGFFGMIVLITLLRAERSVANGALAVITLLSIGVAGAATVHGFGQGDRPASGEARAVYPASAALPQVSCIDDLAGDAVLTACEKVLFGSAESVAAAVAYAASQITLLTSLGDVATANKGAGPDLQALAPGGRAGSLRVDGLRADGAGSLYADLMSGVPFARQQSPDPHQHGRARL